MKQYFLKGIDEPLEFGDTVSFTLVKEKDGKKIERECSVTFSEELIPLLLDEEVIEEREAKSSRTVKEVLDAIHNGENLDEEAEEDKDEPDDDPTLEDVLDAIMEAQEESEKTIEVLAEEVKALKKKVAELEEDKPDADKIFTTIDDYIKRNKDIFKPWHNFRYDPLSAHPVDATVEMFDFAF